MGARRWLLSHRVLTVMMLLALAAVVGTFAFAPNKEPATTASPPAETVLPSPTPSPAISLAPTPSESPTTVASESACRTVPLANVYHPARLRVIEPCATVTGIVRRIVAEDDGDVHIDVQVDRAFATLINAINVRDQDGDLVVEIVPADLPGCTLGVPPRPSVGDYDYGTCTGSNVLTPPLGARIRIVGPYVIDEKHGWAEIHPAWEITVLSGPKPVPATALRIVRISPDPLQPGRTATLTVRTSPRALCAITVRYPSGHVSTAKGLVQKSADMRGDIAWTWNVGASTKSGIGTAIVTCGSLTDQASFTVA